MEKKFDAVFADIPKFSTINVKINPGRKTVLPFSRTSYVDESLDKLEVLKNVGVLNLSYISKLSHTRMFFCQLT